MPPTRFSLSLRTLLCGWVLMFAAAMDAVGVIERQDLKVLYVGGSTDWVDGSESAVPQDPPADDPRVAVRMKSFGDMLRRYFTSVTVMHAKDYAQEKSAAYDVTVMDGTPPALEARRDIKDASGRLTKVIPARYFTEDFAQPVILIGELGDKLGRRVGSKYDWYCLCLDAHAHSFRSDHPIFRGPFPVRLTIEERPIPDVAFQYEEMAGRVAPKSLPMWRVQTKGYTTDKGFRIGMVARPWGFEDSPEAEYISSGVCAKGLDAVALGRHGNYFGWGFAASPEFMSPEAQTVLANAICYIARFRGQGLIARKYDDRIATRDQLEIFKHLATAKTYEKMMVGNREHNERMARLKKEAEAKQAKGEKLDQMERISLQYRPSREPTREEFMQSRFKELYAQFGTDEFAYARYYDENRGYFRPDRTGFGLVLDEDVKRLGIDNSDHRLLEKCIRLWELGSDVEMARRVLERYTLLDFATVSEWRDWYERYKARLFFTQSGGFVFMVNSRDPEIEGNDYSRKEQASAGRALKAPDTDNLNPVSVATAVMEHASGRRELVLKLRIHTGYHIYAHVAANDPFIPTEVAIELPYGLAKVGELRLPSFQPTGSGTTGIYTDEAVFAQEIIGNGSGEAVVRLKYQCCDATICFPPVEQELRVQIGSPLIAAAGQR